MHMYTFHMFFFISPSVVDQIIMPNTACEKPSTLFKFLSDQLPPYAKLSSIQREYFNEAKGNVQFLRLYTTSNGRKRWPI